MRGDGRRLAGLRIAVEPALPGLRVAVSDDGVTGGEGTARMRHTIH